MATLLIFAFIIFAIILLIGKRIKLAIIFLIIALISYWLVGSGVIAYYLLEPLQTYPTLTNPKWKKSNAIVVFGAGTVQAYDDTKEVQPYLLAYGRLTEAAKLYFSCQKTHQVCKLILSGGDTLKTGQSEADNYRQTLTELGVKSNDCILDNQSINTYYNAKNVNYILSHYHFDQIVLVTSGYHITRSKLSLEHFGIHALLAPADTIRAKLSIKPIASNFLVTDIALHEYLGILFYEFYWFKK